MEKSFNIIDKCLKIVLNSNIFDNSQKTWNQIFKIIFNCFFQSLFLIVGFWTLVFSSRIKLHERILLFCGTTCFFGMFLILIDFWFKQDKYRRLIVWVKSLHRKPEHKSNFNSLAEIMWKIVRLILYD